MKTLSITNNNFPGLSSSECDVWAVLKVARINYDEFNKHCLKSKHNKKFIEKIQYKWYNRIISDLLKLSFWICA